jgi:peptidoglycan/LPS O-acetylase OafA/YrhL
MFWQMFGWGAGALLSTAATIALAWFIYRLVRGETQHIRRDERWTPRELKKKERRRFGGRFYPGS